MLPAAFLNWRLQYDPAATSSAYAEMPPLDEDCCNACATWATVIERGVLDGKVSAFLQGAGVDLRKPSEVWGAPDGGFLAGWYLIVGRLDSAAWKGEAEGAFEELNPGLKCWLAAATAVPAEPFAHLELVQLEFTWESEILKDLERVAWPRSAGGRGA